MITLCAPVDLVTTGTECWKCKAVTPVSSLRVQAIVDDDGHRVEDARVTNAQELPQEVVKAVQRVNPHFREGFSRTAEITYWANHCRHCGALQGDFFLNSEPDGPFFGGGVPEGSTTVRLLNAGQWSAEAAYAC
jgi:hypothetical protein